MENVVFESRVDIFWLFWLLCYGKRWSCYGIMGVCI